MAEVLLFVNIGLLVIGSVTLTIAVFVLQKARSYVELSEERMERLREGQEHLFQLLREGRRYRSGELVQEQRPAEPRVEELQKEAQNLHRNRNDRLLQQSSSSRSGDLSEGVAQNIRMLTEENPESGELRENMKIPSITKPRETASTALTQKTPEGKKAGFAVKHAHPDDDVSLRRESEKQGGSQVGAPVKMFREHYHRYLENYEGYVKLAERLCQMREDGEVPPGSPAEREWEQKLRRLKDGIQRTTARLDILEQYNPELASDDRVSHRAGISQGYSELEEKLSGSENS